MNWHCVKAPLFGRYCNGTPDWEKEPILKQLAGEGKGPGDYTGGACKLEPATCGRCQSITDQIPKEELDKISIPNYIEIVIPIKRGETIGIKPKSAKAKKLEAEMAQERFI